MPDWCSSAAITTNGRRAASSASLITRFRGISSFDRRSPTRGWLTARTCSDPIRRNHVVRQPGGPRTCSGHYEAKRCRWGNLAGRINRSHDNGVLPVVQGLRHAQAVVCRFERRPSVIGDQIFGWWPGDRRIPAEILRSPRSVRPCDDRDTNRASWHHQDCRNDPPPFGLRSHVYHLPRRQKSAATESSPARSTGYDCLKATKAIGIPGWEN